MTLNKNVFIVVVAMAMTLILWIKPGEIHIETHQQRLLALSGYLTNPTRLSGVEKFCQGISRNDLINTEEKATAQSYKNAIASSFNVEANKFVNDAINGDAATEAMKISTPLGIFVGFFALGFIVILIQWMCLCCCCCCPSCCPSKCCQKDENEQYTKCELYWPSIFLILLLLLIIIVSAMGISKAGYFKEGLGDIQCSLSMMLDDVVNGNVTASGSYFLGVNPLIDQINLLNTNVNSIKSSLNSVTTLLSTGIPGDFKTMANHIAAVPNGTIGQSASIKYNTPVDGPFPGTGTTESFLVTMLGSAVPGGAQSGIIGQLVKSLTEISDNLTTNQVSSTKFINSIDQFKGNIGDIKGSLGNVSSQIKDLDTSLSSTLDLMNTPKSMGTTVITAIYGVMLGLSVLALLGVILMTFCDKYKCRYLMYFSCVILFFLGILGFLLAMIFSIIVPVLYFLCGWLDVTLQASTFAGNTGKFLTDTQVRDIIGTCLIGGTGDIIGAILKDPVTKDTLNQLKDSVNLTSSFRTPDLTANLTAGTKNISDTLDLFLMGKVFDVLDQNSFVTQSFVAALTGISQPSCPAFSADSFIPSTSYDSLSLYNISCAITGGSIVTGSSCNLASFEANGCNGCIDFSSIYTTHYTSLTRGGLNAKLNTRYSASAGDPCLATWVNSFGNVWDNYYHIKHTQIKAIITRWDNIVNPSVPGNDISKITANFNSLNATLGSAMNTLTSTAQTVIDPKYGMIAGLNCQIIGQDMSLVVGSICVSNFNTIYITRLLMGVAAFAILFSMCCIVCSGVRHYKHAQRKDKVLPGITGEKFDVQNTDLAFRP